MSIIVSETLESLSLPPPPKKKHNPRLKNENYKLSPSLWFSFYDALSGFTAFRRLIIIALSLYVKKY